MKPHELAIQQSKKGSERLSGWGWVIYKDGSLSNYHQFGNYYVEEEDPEEIGKIDELELENHVTRDWQEGDEEPGTYEDYFYTIESLIEEAQEDTK